MFDSYLALRNVAHHAFSNSLLLFEKGCDRDKPDPLFSKPQSFKRNIGFDTSANSKKIVRSSLELLFGVKGVVSKHHELF